MHHRAIGQHRDRIAGAAHHRLAQRHGVMALGHLAQLMRRPGHDLLVVVAVERAVVKPLGFEEDHRVVILDRGDQQALGIIGVRGDDHLEPGRMGETGLGRLRMGLAAKDAAARGHSDHHRAGELPGRAIAHPRRFLGDLVIGGKDVIGELDFHARPQAIGRHADRDPHDAAFGNRRVKAAGLAVFRLQPLGAAEDAAEIADILAKDHDLGVLAHLHVHRVADGLDHRHACHGQIPAFWR